MMRSLIGGALVAGAAVLAGCAATPTEEIAGRMVEQGCSRGELQNAADSYVAAQRAGNRALLFAGAPLTYREQFERADIRTGIINTPLDIDFHHSILDTQQCQTITEIVIADPAHPYVLGVHLTVDHEDGAISEIDTIVTDDDDWLFSAERFLNGIRDEDWSVVPPSQRTSRADMIAGANAYFDMFTDETAEPPFHDPCYRQEGGMRTNGSCHSAPLGVDFSNRFFVVDTTLGVVDGWVLFSDRLPDSHMFRFVDGEIRYIHTITACDTFNCGFDLSEDLAEERRARGGDLGPDS